MKTVVIAAGLGALTLATVACDPPDFGKTSDSTTAVAPAGGQAPATIDKSGANLNYACGSGAVEITGHNSAITLTGTCQSVSVTGADNTVKLATVGSIDTSGVNNTVTWQAGIGGKAPSVSNSGIANHIKQA